MSENQSSRRKFLQLLGLSAGAAIVSKNAIASGFNPEDIRKLTSEQQEFMHHYEKWMDEFIHVIKAQKVNFDDVENHQKMIALTHQAETFQPKLDKYMQDETFAVIYAFAIERMTKDIGD